MEKNYMAPDAVLAFELLEEKKMPMHYHDNPEILFVLEGELRVKTDRQEFLLKNEDFVLINANRAHSYETERNFLAVRYQISLAALSGGAKQGTLLFWCNSVSENMDQDAVRQMRQILKNILFGRINQSASDRFYEKSLDYQLLSLLCNRFLLTEKSAVEGDADENDRMNRVMDYIRSNYTKPIALKDVADALYLSPTYLSKYIHRNSGKGFVELISSVRLSHAVEDLLYTDHTVTRIAMDNGFASAAALNKAFRESYGTTPYEYRKKTVAAVQESGPQLEKAAAYLHSHLMEEKKERTGTETSLDLARQECSCQPIRMKNILNVGQAADLLDAQTQKEILGMRDDLGIRYVRFWNFLDERMRLDRESRKKGFNFDRVDAVLDFLVSGHLCPYIELHSKQVRILRNVSEICEDRTPQDDFESDADRTAFFDAFFGHLIRRYGRSTVTEWIFDYALSEDTEFVRGTFAFRPKTAKDRAAYFRAFGEIAVSLKKRFPDAQIGGAGFPVQHYGKEGLKAFLDEWAQQSVRPDFISFTSFPYQIMDVEGKWYEKRRTGYGFVEEDTEAVRSAAQESGFEDLPLHLQECNLTLSERSYINDTVMRGAFFAHTITELYDRVDFFGIWMMHDAYATSTDTTAYLFGGSGIVSKTGAAKPVYYTLRFLHQLYGYQVMAKENCLVSFNEHGHFKLLLNHLVGMNTAYYVREEDQLSPLGIEQMVESQEDAVYHIRIRNLPEGCWQIRTYRLNQNEGSILNEWLNLNGETGREEVAYLRRICVPHLHIRKQNTSGGVLEFDTTLSPNEVQYIHITEYN